MSKVLLLGTSRLHRPFAKRLNRQLVTNFQDGVEVVFPRMGYFHSAAEILQAVRFLKNHNTLSLDLRPYVFRVEPRSTTPLNEFDPELESAIKESRPYKSVFDLTSITHLMIEVSSLTVNTHTPTGTLLHTNPNIEKNVSYAEIYPEGYYAKFEPMMPVVKSETDVHLLSMQLADLRVELPHAEVMVMGHLRSPNYPNSVRDRIHSQLIEACERSGCSYFDTAPFLNQFGFATVGDVRDMHHLSHEGESALGQAIQTRLRFMSEQC